MKSLELRIPPVAVCLLFAAGIFGLARLVPSATVVVPGHRWMAMALWAIGGIIALAGVVQFHRARTTVDPLTPGKVRAIVCSGVYRYSRNPMYLGLALGLAGVAAWWSTVAGLALVPLFCAWMTRWQIIPEERVLAERFGREFADYATRVRRWI